MFWLNIVVVVGSANWFLAFCDIFEFDDEPAVCLVWVLVLDSDSDADSL